MRSAFALLILACGTMFCTEAVCQDLLKNPAEAGQKSADPKQGATQILPDSPKLEDLRVNPPPAFSLGPFVKLAPRTVTLVSPASGGVCSIPLLSASPKAATVPMPNSLNPQQSPSALDKLSVPSQGTTIDKMRVVVPAPACSTKITILPGPGTR